MIRKPALDVRGLVFALLFAPLLLCFSGAAFGAAPTNQAGVIEEPIQQKPERVEVERSSPLTVPEENLSEMTSLPAGPTVTVSAFELSGNYEIDSSKFAGILGQNVGRALTLEELRGVCAQITEKYRARGFFLARAYLPVQEIRDGIVRIAVVEGRLGDVQVRGSTYYTQYFIKKHFFHLAGKTISYRDLMRVLMLLNEYPELKVHATLKAGAEPGTTDVLIEVEDSNPISVSLDYNNCGSKYVSRNRFGAGVDIGNFTHQGDRFALKGVMGESTDALTFVDAGYTTPVNNLGTKLSVGYTYSNFAVGKDYKVLDIKGESNIVRVDVAHPWIRSRTLSTDLVAGIDFKDIKNEMLGEQTSHDKLRVVKVGVNFDHVDSWKGRNYWSILASYGIPDFLGSMKAEDPDASRVGSGGEFAKYNFEYRRIQQLPWSCFLILKAADQMSNDVLPSSEQFLVGGVDTVRGFPQSFLLGDEGWSLGAELRMPPPFFGDATMPFTNRSVRESFQWRVFIDYGKVKLNGAVADEAAFDDITGAGVGFLLFLPGELNISFDVGFPLTRRNEPDVPDTSYYVQVNKRFL